MKTSLNKDENSINDSQKQTISTVYDVANTSVVICNTDDTKINNGQKPKFVIVANRKDLPTMTKMPQNQDAHQQNVSNSKSSIIKQMEDKIKNLEKQLNRRDTEIRFLKEQNKFLQSNTIRL